VFFDTPPHQAGTVDVVVTNPYAEPARLAAGYRYAPPDSFDFNGTWSGYPLDGSDLSLAFTIRNDRLMSVSCGDTALELGDGVPVKGGEFSFVQSGAAMTGKIVSASQAVGTIDLAPCHAPLWEAAQAR
jgi:hypothetical protein